MYAASLDDRLKDELRADVDRSDVRRSCPYWGMATGGFPDAGVYRFAVLHSVISLNKITVKLVVSTSHNHAASRTGVTHKAIVRRNGRLQVHCKGLEARALWEVLDKEVGDFPDAGKGA